MIARKCSKYYLFETCIEKIVSMVFRNKLCQTIFQLFIHQKWQFYVDFLTFKLLLFQDLGKILHAPKKSLLKNDAKVDFCLNCYEYLCMIVSLDTWRASFKPHGMMVNARIYITYKALIIIFISSSHIWK